MIRRQKTAAPRNFPRVRFGAGAMATLAEALLPVRIKAGWLGTGAPSALPTPPKSSAGHRVVVTVCKVSLVVSALMKVRSTAPQGVGAQALPLSGEYLVGWSMGPRIWTFACG